jgi:hypothetical protein
MNGDGQVDVVAISGSYPLTGALSVFMGLGNGALEPVRGTMLVHEDPRVVIGDFDGDDRPDAVSGSSTAAYGGRLVVARNRGDGTFDMVSGATAKRPTATMLADLDGEGHMDLIVASSTYFWGPSLLVLFNHLARPIPRALSVSLADASYDGVKVHVSWVTASTRLKTAFIERQVENGPWIALGTIHGDGAGRFAFEDQDLAAGKPHRYRLGFEEFGTVRYAGTAQVEVPVMRLALEPVFPNPSSRRLSVRFSVPSGEPATLDVLDITGRRVHRRLVQVRPGRRTFEVDHGAAMSPGVYWLRLSQGPNSATTRFVVVNR